MPLDTVASIAYKNSWDGSQGLMHTSLITFASGLAGEANHKQPTPPYRVGEVVEYQITGEFRGTNKLKVGKPKDGQQGGYQQAPQSSPSPARQNAGNGQQSEFLNGLNRLALLWCHCWNKSGEISSKVGGLTPEQRQSACASLFIEANRQGASALPIPALTSAQPAPATQPAPPTPQQFHTPPPAATAAFANASRPRGGPDGQAFNNAEADFDPSVDF